MGEKRNADSSLIWKPDGKTQLQGIGIERRKIIKWAVIFMLSGWILKYRVGHEKVARLPLCTCPCDILSGVGTYIA
jgi:hypothetical protein